MSRSISELTVHFGFCNIGGRYPKNFGLSAGEDVSCRMHLGLNWSPAEAGLPEVSRIVEVEIFYDGLTPFLYKDPDGQMVKMGFQPLQRDHGYPMPIVRFRFDQPVNDSLALLALDSCNYSLELGDVRDGGCTPIYFEDLNNNSRLILGDELMVWRDRLKRAAAWSGKVYRFQHGVPGLQIPATDLGHH